MTPGLTTLAPELIACILDFVPSIDLQQTTISLLCVLSYSSVPNWRHYLLYHVHLRTPEGISKLVQHLKRVPSDATFVRKITLGSWTVDAKLATDVILMLPELKWLSLCLGVSFTPQHLGKLFRKPMPKLRYLYLRLRPYMLEGNYQRTLVYSFLKSTYFDSVISLITKWPSLDLPTVSVVLDPRDAALAPVANSPDTSVIIFDLYQLETLASSDLLKRTDALRLRLPECELARFLCRNTGSLPSMTFLDATTSRVSASDVTLMLRSLPSLRHLILDGCGTLDEASIDQWVEFGYDCFMINNGVQLEEVENERFASQSLISLEPESAASPPIVGSTRGVSIIPLVSGIRTIALSVPPNAGVNAQQDFTAAFQRGWGKAMTEFNDRLHAARQGRSRGWRVIRFAKPDEIGHVIGHSGYYRMAILDDDDFAQLDRVKGDEDRPVVCLAGKLKTEGGIRHAEGCGHMIGRDVWEDAM